MKKILNTNNDEYNCLLYYFNTQFMTLLNIMKKDY